MPQLQFHIKYNKKTDKIINADDIKRFYLFGINLTSQGQPLPDEVYDYYIDAAFEQLQGYLGIRLKKQVIEESKDFVSDDWKEWGYMRTTYPAVCALRLTGFLGTVQQVDYPAAWLSTRKTSDGQLYQRQIHVVPNAADTVTATIAYTGLLPSINYQANKRIPNYWTMTYVTGFDKIPPDIINVLGKIAALNILTMASDGLLPQPGMTTQTISLDGLSQNTNLNAKGIFANRIMQYENELWGSKNNIGQLRQLYDRYTAITMGVC